MNRLKQNGLAVIIPTFNHSHFLAAAIESVLTQTRPADEIVVIDDGSSDDPATIVAYYPGVRVVHQVNLGLAAARNRGITETRSLLLMFLDADDRLKPDALERSLDSLHRCPEAAFSYGGYELVCSGGVRRPARYIPVPEDAFAGFLKINPVGMHGTVIYRRECLEAVGGFNSSLRACEDYDLYLRLAAKYKVACRPEMLAEYWHHGGNMSHDSAMMLQWSLRVIEAQRANAKAAGLLQELEHGKDWARRLYIGAWIGQLTRGGNFVRVVKRGLKLAGLAPVTMITEVFSRLCAKLTERIHKVSAL